MEALTVQACVAGALVRAYDLTVTTAPASHRVVATSRFRAFARADHERPIVGFGAGATEHAARTRAVLEYVERLAQFATYEPPDLVTGRLDELPEAVAPADFGLYGSRQYAALSDRVTPFTEEMLLDWVPMRDLRTGGERLVPVEVVYPRASLGRPPLVLETSSGTAAHLRYDDALLASLCEVVERDAVLVFWHRQPPTPLLSVELAPDPARDELRRVQEAGYLVIIVDLAYDLGVPCFLVFALRGTGVGYGLGCHPDPPEALAHAVRELGARLAWMGESRHPPFAHLSIRAVVTGDDHYGLYHHGPLHHVLRDVLSSTVKPAGRLATVSAPAGPGLSDVVSTLADHGLPALVKDITPARARDCGAVVVRAVIPGLVPFHVGAGTIRLGCPRLTGISGPGRLRSLLPHFLS